MPTARETLLEAAHEAVTVRPWTGVRMVEIAERAGVSRQTLYNEFGSKEGLGSALVSRRIGGFLDSVAAVAARSARKDGDPAVGCAAAASWMLRTVPSEPLVRSALTGCRDSRMPTVAERTEAPGELAVGLRDRVVAALSVADGAGVRAYGGAAGADPSPATRAYPDGAYGGAGVGTERLSQACDVGLRLALSYLVAPYPEDADEAAGRRIVQVVRVLLR